MKIVFHHLNKQRFPTEEVPITIQPSNFSNMPFHAEVPPVEIAASPAQVREVVRSSPKTIVFLGLISNQLLDFEHISQWHTAHFKSIVVPSGKKAMDLAPGDKLAVSLNSLPLNFTPTVVVRLCGLSSRKPWLTEHRKTHHTDSSGAVATPGSSKATMSLNFYHQRRIQAGPCFSITRNSAECLRIP